MRITPWIAVMLLATTSPAHSENASNPFAAVSNTDVRLQYYDLDGPELYDFWAADGAYMVTPKLKLKYELHYLDTDVSGSSERDLGSAHLKPIYFPEKMVGSLGEWKYKLAVGAELIVDLGDEDKGTGSGSDVVAPLLGLAMVRGNTTLVPIVQHFVDYSGNEVSLTAFRLVAIQSLPKNYWAKLDAKVPVDWEDDEAIPATVEMQLGKMFSPAFGSYIDMLVGVGDDKPYEWGVGVGVRFKY
ncbi:MAG: hypothetical protein ABJ308_03075 [Halieaceae bacterium]